MRQLKRVLVFTATLYGAALTSLVGWLPFPLNNRVRFLFGVIALFIVVMGVRYVCEPREAKP